MIKQRFPFDCMVATLAMYLSKTWEDVYDEIGCPNEGIMTSKAAEFLWTKGFDVIWREAQMPTKKAIVCVLSKNFPDAWHAIYYDGKQFFDPSPRQQFTDWDDVKKSLRGTLEVE